MCHRHQRGKKENIPINYGPQYIDFLSILQKENSFVAMAIRACQYVYIIEGTGFFKRVNAIW